MNPGDGVRLNVRSIPLGVWRNSMIRHTSIPAPMSVPQPPPRGRIPTTQNSAEPCSHCSAPAPPTVALRQHPGGKAVENAAKSRSSSGATASSSDEHVVFGQQFPRSVGFCSGSESLLVPSTAPEIKGAVGAHVRLLGRRSDTKHRLFAGRGRPLPRHIKHRFPCRY